MDTCCGKGFPESLYADAPHTGLVCNRFQITCERVIEVLEAIALYKDQLSTRQTIYYLGLLRDHLEQVPQIRQVKVLCIYQQVFLVGLSIIINLYLLK